MHTLNAAPSGIAPTGAPWRAQQVLRETLTTLYNNTPAGIPGNDDLGTMSAWYVWTAMGLYPQFPAVRDLDIGAPLSQVIASDSLAPTCFVVVGTGVDPVTLRYPERA